MCKANHFYLMKKNILKFLFDSNSNLADRSIIKSSVIAKLGGDSKYVTSTIVDFIKRGIIKETKRQELPMFILMKNIQA